METLKLLLVLGVLSCETRISYSSSISETEVSHLLENIESELALEAGERNVESSGDDELSVEAGERDMESWDDAQMTNIGDESDDTEDPEDRAVDTDFTQLDALRVAENNADENLALKKKTGQSSTAHGGVSSRAVDGNMDGTWGRGSCTHTNIDARPWWWVDFGAPKYIGKIVIKNRDDCCRDRLSFIVVQLQTEKNGYYKTKYFVRYANKNGWKNSKVTVTMTPKKDLLTITFAKPMVAQRVRILRVRRGVLTLCEVKVLYR